MSKEAMTQEEKNLLTDIRVLLNSRFLKLIASVFMLLMFAITFFIQGMYSEMREMRLINGTMLQTTAVLVAEVANIKHSDIGQDSSIYHHEKRLDQHDEMLRKKGRNAH